MQAAVTLPLAQTAHPHGLLRPRAMATALVVGAVLMVEMALQTLAAAAVAELLGHLLVAAVAVFSSLLIRAPLHGQLAERSAQPPDPPTLSTHSPAPAHSRSKVHEWHILQKS